MTDHFLYAQDRAKPKSNEWKKGPKISLSDLKAGRNGVEKISPEELRKVDKKPEDDPEKFNFGKFKGRKIRDVMRENPGYIGWCEENVKGFKKKLKELK